MLAWLKGAKSTKERYELSPWQLLPVQTAQFLKL